MGVAIGGQVRGRRWVRWVGRFFGAAEPETESHGRGAGKVGDVAAVRGSAPTAAARGHGTAVRDRGRGTHKPHLCLAGLEGAPGLPGHFYSSPPTHLGFLDCAFKFGLPNLRHLF